MKKRFNFKTLSEINVTNLVDVTMVLLIVFMITAPMLKSQIEVNLPKSRASTPELREGVILTIKKDGDIEIQKRKIKIENFDRVFPRYYIKGSGKPVYLEADKEVTYGNLINVIDRLKQLGIENISLVTEAEK
jgi:biopolymer transport protein ExbD